MFGNRPPVVACDEMDDQKEAKHQNGFSQNPDDEDDSNFKSSFAVLETETLKQGHSDEDDEELKSENIYDQVVSPNLIEELDLGCVKSGGVLKLETNKFESNLPQNPSTNNVTSGHISHQNSGLTSPALSSSSSSSPDTVGSSAAISNNNFAEEWNGGWLERNIFGTEMSPVAVSTSAAGQQLKEDRIQESIAFAMKVDDELLQSEESSISTDEVKDLHGEESPTTTDRDDSSSDHTTTPESHEELVVQTVTVPTDGLGIATLTNHQDGGTPRNQRIFSGYYDDEKAQLLQTSSPPSPKDAQEGIREGDPCEDGAHHSEDEVIRLEGETRLASSMDNSIHPGRDNDDEARLIALSLNPESCLDMDTTTISTKDSTFCGQSRVQQRVLTENYNDEAFGQIFAKIARETSSVYPSRHRNNLLTDAAFCGISRVHRRELAQEHDEELDKILTSKAVVEPTTNTSFISKNIEQKTKIPAAEGTWRTRRVFAGCHEDEDDEKGMKIGTSDHSPPTTQYPPLSVETGHQNEGDSLVIAQFNSNKHTRGDSISPKDNSFSLSRWIKRTLFGVNDCENTNVLDHSGAEQTNHVESAEQQVEDNNMRNDNFDAQNEDVQEQAFDNPSSPRQMIENTDQSQSGVEGELQNFKVMTSQFMSSSSKRKHLWTEEESIALRQGLKKYGHKKLKWSLIKADSKFGPILQNRSNVALKDRARCKLEQPYMMEISKQIMRKQGELADEDDEPDTEEEQPAKNKVPLQELKHKQPSRSQYQCDTEEDDEEEEYDEDYEVDVDPTKVTPLMLDLTGQPVELDGVKGIVSSYLAPYWIVTFEDEDTGDYTQEEIHEMSIKLATQEGYNYGGDDERLHSGDEDLLYTEQKANSLKKHKDNGAMWTKKSVCPEGYDEALEDSENLPPHKPAPSNEQSNKGVFKNIYKRGKKLSSKRGIVHPDTERPSKKKAEDECGEWSDIELQALQLGMTKYADRLNKWNLIKSDNRFSKKLIRRSVSSLRAKAYSLE